MLNNSASEKAAFSSLPENNTEKDSKLRQKSLFALIQSKKEGAASELGFYQCP